MADTDFKGYLIVFLVLALFMVAVVNFGSGVFDEYGKEGNFVDEDTIHIQEWNTTLTDSNDETDSLVDSFVGDNFLFETGTLVLKSIWGILTNIIDSISTLLDLFVTFSEDVLGIPSLALGTLITVIMIGVLFAGWKVIRVGE